MRRRLPALIILPTLAALGAALAPPLGVFNATAVNRMRRSTAKSKVVVLVTDGRSNAGQLGPESAAEAARALGVKVYTIGVGSEGEVPCLVDDPQQGRRYVNIRADFDEAVMRSIAEKTGARYFRAADADGAGAFASLDIADGPSLFGEHVMDHVGQTFSGAAERGPPWGLLFYGVVGGAAGIYVGLKERWWETRFLSFGGGWAFVFAASRHLNEPWAILAAGILLAAPVCA